VSDPNWKSRELPAVNSRWDRKLELGMGARTVRVMGVVEGYVVARLSGSTPFLVHMSDWHDAYEPKPMTPGRRGKPQGDE
jgi:hypothetical protein